MNDMRQQSRAPLPAAVPVRDIPTDDDFQRLLERDAKTITSYIPYGAQDEIKLTVATVQSLIAVKTKKGHTCSRSDALKFIAMCKAKRLNPFEGDCFLIGYDTQDGPSFALVTAHQTYLKRAELHAEFDGMQSGIIVKDEAGNLTEIEGDFYDQGQSPVGGWAKVFFKTRKHPMYKRLRIGRFNSGFAQWKVDAPGMVCKCAEADALRSAFPTMLGGLYMQEERETEPVRTSKPDFTTKPNSTPLFGGKASPEVPSEPEPQAEPEAPQPDAPPDCYNPDDGPDMQPVPDQKAPAGNGANYVKGVRSLCAAGRIKEGEVLDFLQREGVTDGSVVGLEFLPEPTLKSLYDNWSTNHAGGGPGISTQIIAARKAGAK